VLDPAALRARLDSVRERIADAARRVGRDPAGTRLVAISKTFSIEAIRAAAAAGQRDFGENKIQEALPKIEVGHDLEATWHFVGHLQSNKARKAAQRFDVIHSVDTADLALRLDNAAREASRTVQLLIQVDLAGEASKHGTAEKSLPAILSAAAACRAARVVGLMLLPPAVDEPEAARPYFKELVALRDRLVAGGADPSMLMELSMGMSHDFEVAVEEGATMVRVGSAIFGSRPTTAHPPSVR
jgi:pyridoxal phosphate enzyme (YggS family)